MKCKATFILFFIYPMLATAQVDTSTIIQEIKKTVDNHSTEGRYVFSEKHILLREGEDTSIRTSKYQYYFRQNEKDSLLTFKISSYSINRDNQDKVYDGENIYIQTGWQRRLEVLDKKNILVSLQRLKGESSFYPFFVTLGNQFRSLEKRMKLGDLRLISKDSVNGEACLKLAIGQQITAPSGKTTDVYYFVSEKTFLPIQQSVVFKSKIGQVSETEIFQYSIENFENRVAPDSVFSRAILKEYDLEVPYGAIKNNTNLLLAIGQPAPDWELPSLENKTVKLTDFKNKIVILDFWYKACIPCLNQMLDLQKIDTAYKGKEVVIIGINTRDDPKKDKLSSFLERRKVTTLNVYNGYKIQPVYKATLSPVLYVIDKKGQILFAQDGYSKTMITDLKKILDIALE